MKKLAYFMSATFLAATMILSSCKKSDDPVPTPQSADASLTIDQNNPGTTNQDYTVFTSDSRKVIEVKAITTTNNNMKRVYVYKTEKAKGQTASDPENENVTGSSTDGAGNHYFSISDDKKNEYSLKISVDIDNDETRDEDVYYFYFTKDVDFDVNNQGSDVITGPGTITLIYDSKLTHSTDGQKLYSICNADQDAAYDLTTFSKVSTSLNGSNEIQIGTGADLVNQGDQGDQADCGTFRKGWDRENGTTFKKASNGFGYDNATHNDLDEEFNSGINLSPNAVDNVAVGDLYIAKLRGGNNYAIIKITGITEGTNNFIEFSAKRK
ncbi:MAG: hypothetical protein JWM14_934 [Chitinophagaceae bacterium]|nr:hypothetical protein [Chitinophagaceae bacterium]